MDYSDFRGVFQRTCDLDPYSDCGLFRDRSAFNCACYGISLNVLHDQELDVVLFVEIIDLGNVWVTEFRQKQSFLLKAFMSGPVADRTRSDHLEGHVSI